MMNLSWTVTIFGFLCIAQINAFSSTSSSVSSSARLSENVQPTRLQHQRRHMTRQGHEDGPLSNKKHCRCPQDDELLENDDEESLSLDRREAAFAMLGGLWATAAVPGLTAEVLFGNAKPAFAKAGTDAKIQLPDVIGGMSDRVNKQCLVESLGNRECLVYMEDSEKFLYKGDDAQVLLDRIESASRALATIPGLVEAKKWNQVTGALTGPMGQLSLTMTALAKVSSDPAKNDKKAKQVKQDVFAIGSAATNKDSKGALKAHEAATQHLVEFVKLL